MIVAGQDDLFLQLFRPQSAGDDMKARMSFPPADLAVLHAIAPIGNKFHKAADTGPMGERTTAAGVYRGVIYLRFGGP